MNKIIGFIVLSVFASSFAFAKTPILLPTGNLACMDSETLVVTPIGTNEVSIRCIDINMRKTGGKCDEPELCHSTEIEFPNVQEI